MSKIILHKNSNKITTRSLLKAPTLKNSCKVIFQHFVCLSASSSKSYKSHSLYLSPPTTKKSEHYFSSSLSDTSFILEREVVARRGSLEIYASSCFNVLISSYVTVSARVGKWWEKRRLKLNIFQQKRDVRTHMRLIRLKLLFFWICAFKLFLLRKK